MSFEDDQDRVLGFIQLAKESGYMSFNGSKDDFILAKILCEPLGLKCCFGKKQIHIHKPVQKQTLPPGVIGTLKLHESLLPIPESELDKVCKKKGLQVCWIDGFYYFIFDGVDMPQPENLVEYLKS